MLNYLIRRFYNGGGLSINSIIEKIKRLLINLISSAANVCFFSRSIIGIILSGSMHHLDKRNATVSDQHDGHNIDK